MAAVNGIRGATATRIDRGSKLLTGEGLDRDLLNADSVGCLPLLRGPPSAYLELGAGPILHVRTFSTARQQDFRIRECGSPLCIHSLSGMGVDAAGTLLRVMLHEHCPHGFSRDRNGVGPEVRGRPSSGSIRRSKHALTSIPLS